MKRLVIVLLLIFAGWQAAVFLFGQGGSSEKMSAVDSSQAKAPFRDSASAAVVRADTNKKRNLALPKGEIDTKNVHPQQVVDFAKTLIGVPYKYGSTNPEEGFDCSGFVTHVFSHFNILIPRSSIDFTHVGEEISALDSKPGDLVLFTGTDSADKFVGHMGIVVSNDKVINFIHSTSGKQQGVTITPLNGYYKGRYVKTIRIFPQNKTE